MLSQASVATPYPQGCPSIAGRGHPAHRWPGVMRSGKVSAAGSLGPTR